MNAGDATQVQRWRMKFLYFGQLFFCGLIDLLINLLVDCAADVDHRCIIKVILDSTALGVRSCSILEEFGIFSA